MRRSPPPGPPPPAPKGRVPSREPDSVQEPSREKKAAKRSWKLRLAELALWIAVALATAVILVSLSERILPTNF